MSGETEAQVSGWTTDTLHSHLSLLITELDRRNEARFTAQEKAVLTALTEVEKAKNKADVASDKRFAAVNEFRETLADQTATFLPRVEFDAVHKALGDKVLSLTSRLDKLEAIKLGAQENRTEQRSDVSVSIAMVTVVVTLILGVLAIISFVASRT